MPSLTEPPFTVAPAQSFLGWPVVTDPGGLRPEQVFAPLCGVAARGRVLGMDMVEIAPSVDFTNALTCITAGRLVMNLPGAVFGPGNATGNTRR